MAVSPLLFMGALEDTSKDEGVQHHIHQSHSTFMNHQEQRRLKLEKRKKSEPIQFKKLERSYAKEQLYQDEKVAEYRDYCMYLRIVHGMVSNSSKSPTSPVDPSIANVVRTRHAYKTMSDFSVNEKLSIPVLCNHAPLAPRPMQLAYAPRRPIDTRLAFLPRHLPLVDAIHCADVIDNDCSVDAMFDLDL